LNLPQPFIAGQLNPGLSGDADQLALGINGA
jgi:hypothetical protein